MGVGHAGRDVVRCLPLCPTVHGAPNESDVEGAERRPPLEGAEPARAVPWLVRCDHFGAVHATANGERRWGSSGFRRLRRDVGVSTERVRRLVEQRPGREPLALGDDRHHRQERRLAGAVLPHEQRQRTHRGFRAARGSTARSPGSARSRSRSPSPARDILTMTAHPPATGAMLDLGARVRWAARGILARPLSVVRAAAPSRHGGGGAFFEAELAAEDPRHVPRGVPTAERARTPRLTARGGGLLSPRC